MKHLTWLTAIAAAGCSYTEQVDVSDHSAFFPVAINTAAGVRQVNPVLVRVGLSFRLSATQMATRVYLPALRASLVTGMRLGFGLVPCLGRIGQQVSVSRGRVDRISVKRCVDGRRFEVFADGDIEGRDQLGSGASVGKTADTCDQRRDRVDPR